jgi:copper transport protein
MRRMSIWGGLLGSAILLLVAGLTAAPVLAHANLIRSTPASGEILAQPPAILELEFSEPVDPALFSVQLLDASSQVVAAGPGDLDPDLPTFLRLELPLLEDGAYTTSWQVRSAVDGHVTQGLVNFAVGLSSPLPSLLPPPGVPDPAFILPAPLETIARWGSFIFTALLAGSLSFRLLILKRNYNGRSKDAHQRDEGSLGLVKRLVWLGVIGSALFSTILFILQSSSASDLIPGASSPWLAVLSGRSGLAFGMRLILLAILGWTVRRLPEERKSPAGAWWLAAALSMLVLLTFSLQSHSAATGSMVSIVMDWLHRAAVAVWIGGLVPLALLLRAAKRNEHSQPDFSKLVASFSRLAITCVILLTGSGMFSAFQQVRTIEALFYSSYGRALLIKTGLFVLLFGLGAINLLFISPRLVEAASNAIRRLSQTVRAEIFLSALVLLSAGVMAGAPPAYEALQNQKRLGLIQVARDGEVDMKLYVFPAKVGENELGIDLLNQQSGARFEDAELWIRFTPPDPDLGIFQIEAAHQENSRRFSARGSHFSIIGVWQVEVILRQPGIDDARRVFEVPIRADLPDHNGRGTNSVDAQVSAHGQELYQAYCQSCHGPEGKGDGPVGLNLPLPPADLSSHVAPGEHTDQQLYYYISEGFPRSAMPAFKNLLSEEERWLLVHYIRTFYQE